MREANPQGKGLVPVLLDWNSAQPVTVKAKSPAHILSDYFTSMLVLSAEFAFQPRTGVTYYLYCADSHWRLSLIAPGEWRGRQPGTFLGECRLQPDMTWELEPREDLGAQTDLFEALTSFHEGFCDHLKTAGNLEEGLPFYAAQLPYYRRLFAAGLASSLSKSISIAGLDQHSHQQWLSVLTHQPAPPLALDPGRN